jgi:DNA-binding SARP family transcriptional activator
MVRFGVLGPLVAEDAKGPMDLKGPRHRAVLARLLIARGRVVPVDRLVDDLWEVPPEGAVGAIQTFVSALRRALEPDRAPRAPAHLLVTMAPGYALRAAPEAVNARRFEAAVTRSGELLAARRAEAALSQLDVALALWRGPAFAEFGEHAWARGEVATLDELRLLAMERRSEALLALGRAAETVPGLEAQVKEHPWREDGWRLLALALYLAGRQGDALGALRRARQVLATDLGLDPGPGLRRLESDILAQSTPVPAPPANPARPLIGRDHEAAQLEDAAAATITDGRLGLVLISGDAGAGKTALAESFDTRLKEQGWTTAWGSSPEHEGAPAAWPWSRILDTLAAAGHKPPPVPELEDQVAARFHWHRAVGSYLADVARRSPLLLVLDDLHWAGEETLALLASVVTEPVTQPILALATYRATDVSTGLTDLLGRVARTEPTRIHLGGLSPATIPALVHTTIGRNVDPATAEVIHRRSAGNPFFARELARLFDTEGQSGLAKVPPGVRDVVRHRLAGLPEAVQETLRLAAIAGTDLELLAALTGNEDQVLDALETATLRGFLVERGPRRFQFAHALVRDTLYDDLSHSRRARRHAAIAQTIERLRPDDVDALAHHFLLAEDPALANRTARYTRAAAEQAERRFAPHEAARWWQAAHEAHEAHENTDTRGRLELIMGMVRALALTGSLDQARRHRATAISLAESLDDPVLTTQVIGAFDVPAIWTDNDDPGLARRIADVTERTLASLPPDRTADRCRLLATLAVELRNTGGDRARAAAWEAENLARELDDPALLAFALNARFMQSFDRAGLAPDRAGIGAELVELAARHDLVTFEVLGHLILVQAHSALADFAAADRHAAAADRLGEDYRLPLVSVFTHWYQALRTAVSGHPTDYRAAAALLAGTGMTGLDDGILSLALLCHQLQQGRPGRTDDDAGAYQSWCRPFGLLASGQRDQARAAASNIPDSPRDLLYEARTCLRAILAVEFDDRPTMQRLHADLLPAAAELAGAGSGLLTLRPVAYYLGELATALGHPRQAADHYRQALALAEQAGAPHWADAARAALASVLRSRRSR